MQNETGACPAPRNDTWYDINDTSMNICTGDGLGNSPSKNEMRVAFRIVIPGDTTGYKEDELTFTSS
jgi:hypothetical protein